LKYEYGTDLLHLRSSLQKFKLNIANTVVNEQNSGLDTMHTDQLLDLFDVDTGEGAKQDQSSHAGAHSTKPRALEGYV
jgi:TATA-binding protein-associated factor